jgi:hypothetical protein
MNPADSCLYRLNDLGNGQSRIRKYEISSHLRESHRTLRDGSLSGAVPGTSCQATIAPSLRDISHADTPTRLKRRTINEVDDVADVLFVGHAFEGFFRERDEEAEALGHLTVELETGGGLELGTAGDGFER